MHELTKLWDNSTDKVTITYKGNGNDSVIIQSDPNEDLDREMDITFKADALEVRRTIKQEGMREEFTCLDGEFVLNDSETFNVLK